MNRTILTCAVSGWLFTTSAIAQTESHDDMLHGEHNENTQRSQPTAMDHSEHAQHAPAMQLEDADHSQHMQPAQMDHSTMNHGAMDHGSMNVETDTTLRDPHAYSGGFDFGPLPRPVLGDEHAFGYLLADTFEVVNTPDELVGAYSLYGWYGRDINRLVFKSEGEATQDELHEASLELHWGHALTAFWNTQLGMRYDTGEADDKIWLAAGIQGLAPYWFEIDATAYIDTDARVAFRMEAEYELLLTQKLVLQPVIETNIYSKKDDTRAIGAGLSDLHAGLRLRYEIRREFAPYLGMEWRRTFGESADLLEAANIDTSEFNAVAGIRFWF